MSKNLVYDIRDKPKFSKMIVFAFQQLLAIIAATIAVSGLKMIQKVDLEDHANLFTVSVILITGIGGMSMAMRSHSRYPYQHSSSQIQEVIRSY